ncbi:MAG: type I methionyl aminopeptidase [Ilumatobacteraceae bacterium]
MNRLRANERCWCGSRAKLKRCHGEHERYRRRAVQPGSIGPMRPVDQSIARPPYVGTGRRSPPAGHQIFGGEALERLRNACRIAAEVLLEAGAAVAPGMTTDELDAIAHAAYIARGAYPSTLGYGTYTKSVCTSVNDIVCHGIPDDRPLGEGDIVNIDVTAYIDGMHGDTSATFAVGGLDALDEPTRSLVHATREATLAGIAAVAPGRPLRHIGRAVESVASPRGYGIVRDYGGHGIGEVFHGPPHVSHVEARTEPVTFVPGMCFTIEPMLTAGAPTHHAWDDGWTVATDDGLPSAQFEHTVVVTDDGAEVLTVTAGGGGATHCS